MAEYRVIDLSKLPDGRVLMGKGSTYVVPGNIRSASNPTLYGQGFCLSMVAQFRSLSH